MLVKAILYIVRAMFTDRPVAVILRILYFVIRAVILSFYWLRKDLLVVIFVLEQMIQKIVVIVIVLSVLIK